MRLYSQHGFKSYGSESTASLLSRRPTPNSTRNKTRQNDWNSRNKLKQKPLDPDELEMPKQIFKKRHLSLLNARQSLNTSAASMRRKPNSMLAAWSRRFDRCSKGIWLSWRCSRKPTRPHAVHNAVEKHIRKTRKWKRRRHLRSAA